MKITMIIGEPASGKSRLMSEFMSQRGPWTDWQVPLVRFHQNDKGVRVLGRPKVVTNLDGDNLCQECANAWVQGEGIAAMDDGPELF